VGEKNADGTQQVTAGFTREVMKASMPMTSFNYDSGNKVADNTPVVHSSNQNKPEVLIVGMKITTVYDQDGKPITSEGGEEFFKKLLAQYPKDEVELAKGRMTDEESKQITTDSTFLFYGIPIKMLEAPVSFGDTWKIEDIFELPMQRGGGGKLKTNVKANARNG